MNETTIYINGARRTLMTPLDDLKFYVDHPDLPGRRCAQHHLPASSVMHLRSGGDVFTSGNRYSLHPDAPEGPIELDDFPFVPPLRRIWARIRNFIRN